MMCCATGLPVPDWVRRYHVPARTRLASCSSSTNDAGRPDMRERFPLDFQNKHVPSVIIRRYPFRALLHANLFSRARVAAPRLGTQVTDLLRVWNLDCFCRVPEIGDMGHFDARLDTWAHVRSPGCGSRVV